jgi:hypothetical protein
MNVQVSCPVFRCPQTSAAQCTGYRGICDRYYCQTHNAGTLCGRCANLKQESLKAGYKGMLKGLARKSYSAAMTGSIITLFFISVVLIVSAIFNAYWQKSGESYLLLFVVLLTGGILGLIVTLVWYLMKTREFMRRESVELDLNHPGFYDYYRQWQDKFDEITTNNY